MSANIAESLLYLAGLFFVSLCGCGVSLGVKRLYTHTLRCVCACARVFCREGIWEGVGERVSMGERERTRERVWVWVWGIEFNPKPEIKV